MVAGLIQSVGAADNPLAESGWRLVTLKGAPAVAGVAATLNFRGGRVDGSDGCNHFVTSGTAIPQRIILGTGSSARRAGSSAKGTTTVGTLQLDAARMASTRKACPEPVMKQADAYVEALGKATGFETADGRLTLKDKAGNALAVFEAQSMDLAGTSWLVTGVNNGKQAVVSVALGTTLTASFADGGKMSGSAGCNRFTATYESEGNAIQIMRPAASRRMCMKPAGVMEQEAQFLRALSTAATYRLDGDRLELRTAEGALAVGLRKAPERRSVGQ
jgi:heat shock protein HslJ